MSNRSLTPSELQQRLILFGLAVCRALRGLERDRVIDHFVLQLVRSATSPAANYAEAMGAESQRDFVHKMQICLKEIRESDVWLQFVSGVSDDVIDCTPLRSECNQLASIFVASLKTAKGLQRRSES